MRRKWDHWDYLLLQDKNRDKIRSAKKHCSEQSYLKLHGRDTSHSINDE